MELNIFSLAGVAIAGAVLSLVIRKNNPEQSFAITVSVCVLLLIWAIPSIASIMSTVNSISNYALLDDAAYLFKAVGICLVAQLAARVCVDYGQGSIASTIETAGTAAVVVLSLPMIEELLKIITGLINR